MKRKFLSILLLPLFLAFCSLFSDDKQSDAIIRRENGEQLIRDILSLDEEYEKQSLILLRRN